MHDTSRLARRLVAIRLFIYARRTRCRLHVASVFCLRRRRSSPSSSSSSFNSVNLSRLAAFAASSGSPRQEALVDDYAYTAAVRHMQCTLIFGAPASLGVTRLPACRRRRRRLSPSILYLVCRSSRRDEHAATGDLERLDSFILGR